MSMDRRPTRDYAAGDVHLEGVPVTEAEWLAAIDPWPMLRYMHGKASDRKMRLYAVWRARQIWDVLTEPADRRLIESAEMAADGECSKEELRKAIDDAFKMPLQLDAAEEGPYDELSPSQDGGFARYALFDWHMALHSQAKALYEGRIVMQRPCKTEAETRLLAVRAERLRDIFGNPFRPKQATDADRLTRTDAAVRRLSKTAYYERRALPEATLDNDLLALLANALEDAGCTDAEVLGHLREPGPHVRGCWAVDLILGKE
jgi:hypothetical protein